MEGRSAGCAGILDREHWSPGQSCMSRGDLTRDERLALQDSCRRPAIIDLLDLGYIGTRIANGRSCRLAGKIPYASVRVTTKVRHPDTADID